jgi:hypothetical protein
MKILVVVMSCHKNWGLWKNIKEKVNNNLIIFSYSPKNENWYDENERILYLNCRDTYECLPEKVICMIDEILKNPRFSDVTHILKIDDYEAVHLNEEKIKNLYNYNEIRDNHYVGQDLMRGDGNGSADESARKYHYGKVTPNSEWDNNPYLGAYVNWFNGGKSYILSRHAMSCINSKYNPSNLDVLYKKEIYEDLMIAKCLYKSNIQPYHLDYRIV